ncbi:MAG: hypothetical protein ACAH80_16315 [Alphaproteobacteria bacterium]
MTRKAPRKKPQGKKPLSPAEQFLRDHEVTYHKRNGVIVVTGELDISKDKRAKLGWSPLTELPDLSAVVVEGDFRCNDNLLTSLKGAPQTVTGFFYCYSNWLEDLEGCPKKIGGSFSCGRNHIKDLTGGPAEVGGGYNCQSSPNMLSLKGAPEKIPGDFLCHEGVLESLEGGPREVQGSYWVQKNRLRSLAGAPRTACADVLCYGNDCITHLEGAPETFVRLHTDLGDFEKPEDIPENLRLSPETRARQAEERRQAAARELEQNILDATVTSRPVMVRKSTLSLKAVPRP